MGAPKGLSIWGKLVDKTIVFVYCDIVAPQFVAGQNLRTLRIIIYPSRDGEHGFQNVYFLPVEKWVFKISIYRCD